jgi:zinc and cadmium transporter
MTSWLLSLGSVGAVSLVSLAGLATLSLSETGARRLAALLVSFAVGALLGDAFIHLIPQAFEQDAVTQRPSLLILGGMLLFFVVEKLLRHEHGLLHKHHHPEASARPALAAINVFGDAIHNFIDGVLIAASYLVSPALGVATTVAVLFHEIPQELGDFGILVLSGLSVRRAVLLNIVSASVAILGAITALLLGAVSGAAVTLVLIPVTAGGFVYIAAADLIPELQHDRTGRGLLLQVSLIALGMGVMGFLAILEWPTGGGQ